MFKVRCRKFESLLLTFYGSAKEALLIEELVMLNGKKEL